MGLLWIFVLLGAVLGGMTTLSAVTADSAPKQAAAAAIGVALAVIPYCFARACQFLGQDAKLAELRALNEAMGVHTRLLAASANALNPVAEPLQQGK